MEGRGIHPHTADQKADQIAFSLDDVVAVAYEEDGELCYLFDEGWKAVSYVVANFATRCVVESLDAEQRQKIYGAEAVAIGDAVEVASAEADDDALFPSTAEAKVIHDEGAGSFQVEYRAFFEGVPGGAQTALLAKVDKTRLRRSQ